MRRLLSKKIVLLFGEKGNDACPVRSVWEILTQRYIIFLKFSFLLVDEPFSDFQAFIKAKKLKLKNFSKVVVFGNKDRYASLISFCREEDPNIAIDWFNVPTDTSLAIFFVPGGASILSEDQTRKWDWVSFAANFHFMVGKHFQEKESSLIYQEILKAIYKHDNSKQVKKAVTDILENTINKLEKESPKRKVFDAINVLRFNQANLISKL